MKEPKRDDDSTESHRALAVEPHDCAGSAVHDVTMFGSLSRPGEPRPAAATKSSVQLFKQPTSPSSLRKQGHRRSFFRRPGQANGSRESALNDRLRASRDPYAVSHVWRDTVRRLSRKNVPLWLWVPAFAGTTMRGIPRTHPCSRGVIGPSLAQILRPIEGVGNAGCPSAPAASHGKNKNHTSIVTTVAPVSPGIPAREWF
jgi:hypothetical protein